MFGSSWFPFIPHQICFVCENKFHIQKSDETFKKKFDLLEDETQNITNEIWILEVEIKVKDEEISKLTVNERMIKDKLKDKIAKT